MGRVPWAANDPVFWMHHCNIDRLWASWNGGGRSNPVSNTWLSKPFVFADENGNRVLGTIRDFVNINALGYTYDRFEPIPPCPPGAGLSVPTPQRRAAVLSGPVLLRAQPVRINLEPSGAAAVLGDDIINRVRTLRADRRLYLVLRNLQTQIQPGVVYQVYLELPAVASAGAARNFLVGTINFFGAEAHEHGAAVQNRFFSFDITQLARTLVARSRLSANPSVTIAPAGQPAADASPVIGEITLYEQ
jgi:tyrosinase